MYWLSKVGGALLMPLSLVTLAAITALVLLFTRRYRLGRGLMVVAVAALYFLSWEPFASRLIAPLEERYPALLEPAEVEAPVAAIVVLGHGHRLDARIPVTGQANPDGVMRVLEGVRLQRYFPEASLWLTGGAIRGATPNAEVIHRLMRATGLDASAVERFSEPRNTAQEARAVAQRLEARRPGEKVVLVTEASHMPRAMALFRGQGIDPIPAPTRHRARRREPAAAPHPGELLKPGARALRMSERAFHEYIGIAWAYLRGQLETP